MGDVLLDVVPQVLDDGFGMRLDPTVGQQVEEFLGGGILLVWHAGDDAAGLWLGMLRLMQ